SRPIGRAPPRLLPQRRSSDAAAGAAGGAHRLRRWTFAGAVRDLQHPVERPVGRPATQRDTAPRPHRPRDRIDTPRGDREPISPRPRAERPRRIGPAPGGRCGFPRSRFRSPADQPPESGDDPIDRLVDAALAPHPELVGDALCRPSLFEPQLDQAALLRVECGDRSAQMVGGTPGFALHDVVLGAVRAPLLAELITHVIEVFEQTPGARANRLRVEVVRKPLQPAVAELALDVMDRSDESVDTPDFTPCLEAGDDLAAGQPVDVVEAE